MAIRRYNVVESFTDFNRKAHVASYTHTPLEVTVREEPDELSLRRQAEPITTEEVAMNVLSVGRGEITGSIIVHAQLRHNEHHVMIVASDNKITYEEIS